MEDPEELCSVPVKETNYVKVELGVTDDLRRADLRECVLLATTPLHHISDLRNLIGVAHAANGFV